MDHPVVTASILVAGLLLGLVAQWRGWRPSMRTALATGIVLRVGLLVLAASDSWQPVDFDEGFRWAGQAILAHQDPVLATDGSWHFLPMVPYLYALALSVGIPWEIAGRLFPMVADIVLIVLVGHLARGTGASKDDGTAPLRAFQYACAPLALMISTIHAQVEPLSLVFLVGAYLAARSRRALLAGLLFGFALSAKSWPVILLPVMLAMLPDWRRRAYGLVAAGAIPFLFLITMPLGLGTPFSRLPEAASFIGGVRPIVGEWGWTALLTGGNWELQPGYARWGQVVLYSVLLAVAWLWRRADRIDLTSAMLLAFMLVTPRLGAQYLLWFAPFLIARPTRWSQAALAASAGWAAIGYLYLTQFDDTGWWENHTWWAMSSVAVIPFLLLAMPWSRRRAGAGASPRARRGERPDAESDLVASRA